MNCRAKDFHGESYYDIYQHWKWTRVQRFDAVGPEVFIAVVYDSEAVFLSPGGT